MYEQLLENTGTKQSEHKYSLIMTVVYFEKMNIKTNEYVPSCGFLEAVNICLNA